MAIVRPVTTSTVGAGLSDISRTAGGLPPEWEGIVFAYELDGTGGTELLDASLNGIDLVDTSTLLTPIQNTGVIGDGRGSNIGYSPNQSAYTTTTNLIQQSENEDFTFMFFAHLTVGTAGGVFFQNGGTPTTSPLIYMQWNGTANQYRWLSYPSGDNYYTPTPSPALSTGWNHVTCRYTSATSTMSLIYNGTNINNQTSSTIRPYTADSGNAEIHLVTGPGTSGNCYMDLVRWFNRSLSDAEVEGHYNSGAGVAYPT